MNLIKIGFSLMILPIIIFGGLLNFFEHKLPVIIKQCFRYGKFAYNGEKNVLFTKLELPKSSFKHFYVFSTAYSSLVLLVMLNVYIFDGKVPLGFIQLLDLCVGTDRSATVSAFSSLLAIILLTIQCYRRLYETHYVSVFSKQGKINLSHYIVGFAHYCGAIGAIIAEAPQFSKTETFNAYFSIWDLRLLDFIGTGIFIWGWTHQYISAIILANLRKDNRGAVVTHEHKLPAGDLFDIISSPHVFTEIIIYFGLLLILLGNSTWNYVFLWVLVNQVQVAIMNHKWYKQTFKDYPVKRKAIIPYIY